MWIFFLDTHWNCSHQTIFTLLRACMHNKDYATQIKVKNEIFLQRRENQIESFCACVSLSYILCENFTLAWFLDPYDRVLHYLIRNFTVLEHNYLPDFLKKILVRILNDSHWHEFKRIFVTFFSFLSIQTKYL